MNKLSNLNAVMSFRLKPALMKAARLRFGCSLHGEEEERIQQQQTSMRPVIATTK